MKIAKATKLENDFMDDMVGLRVKGRRGGMVEQAHEMGPASNCKCMVI